MRRLAQLQDNLQALNVRLPAELAARLEASTGFETGFPHDFIAGMQTSVFGEVAIHVDGAANCHPGPRTVFARLAPVIATRPAPTPQATPSTR